MRLQLAVQELEAVHSGPRRLLGDTIRETCTQPPAVHAGREGNAVRSIRIAVTTTYASHHDFGADGRDTSLG